MTKFKAGDRVRVRGYDFKGRIIAHISGDSTALFQQDGGSTSVIVKTECLIRLKPRAKLREFYIGVYYSNGKPVYHLILPDQEIGGRDGFWVREVRKKTPAPRADESE